eukprot:2030203-Rhodomonas_salina.1
MIASQILRADKDSLNRFCAAGGSVIKTAVSDRFGDYGIVGVVLIRKDDAEQSVSHEHGAKPSGDASGDASSSGKEAGEARSGEEEG